MSKFGRLLTAMVTPFHENGDVDYKGAKLLAKKIVASGSDGLVVDNNNAVTGISGVTMQTYGVGTHLLMRLNAEQTMALNTDGVQCVIFGIVWQYKAHDIALEGGK